MRKKRSKIIVVNSDYKTLYYKLEKAMNLYGSLPLESDATVVIKINLCDARTPDTGAITHPLFLDAILRFLRENYGYSLEIKVVESDATVALPDLFIEWFGFAEILNKWNAKYVNLSRDAIVYKETNGRVLKSVPVPKTINDADFFITVPKLKTNSLTKITCCLKNQFGCLPTVRKNKYHNVIDDVIVEVNTVMRPDLCIVDGIISHVGIQGPAFGHPFHSNLILVGNDPVAIDAFVSKLLGFNPKSVGHIVKARRMGIGEMEYYLVGDANIHRIYKPNSLEWLLFKFGLYLRNITRKRTNGGG